MLGDNFFSVGAELFSSGLRRESGGWFRRSLGFRFVRLRAASLEGSGVSGRRGPLAHSRLIRVRYVGPVAPVLTGLAFWNPRVVVWVPTLSDLARVLPVIPRLVVLTRFACGDCSILGRARITSGRRRSRFCRDYFVHIDRIG